MVRSTNPQRYSASLRKELKRAFKAAKEELKTDLLVEVERAVLPPHLYNLKRRLGAHQSVNGRRAGGRSILPLSPSQLAKCFDLFGEQQTKKLRDVNMKGVMER